MKKKRDKFSASREDGEKKGGDPRYWEKGNRRKVKNYRGGTVQRETAKKGNGNRAFREGTKLRGRELGINRVKKG